MRRQPSWWVMVVIIGVCAPLQLRSLVEGNLNRTSAGVAFALVVLQSLALGLIAYWVGKPARKQQWQRAQTHRQVRALAALAFAWGFTVVPVVAASANAGYYSTLHRLGLDSFAASIAAPVDEDPLRLAGVLGVLALVAAVGQVTPLDGLRYGFVVGAGFEIAENAAYVIDSSSAANGGAGFAAELHLAAIRTGLGFGLHAFWTAIAAAALAYCWSRLQRGQRANWWVLAIAFAIPLLLHALWDTPALSIRPDAKMPLFAALYLSTIGLFLLVAVLAKRTTFRDEPNSSGQVAR
ncbi:MAG TPA: PrsW family glutamic-type intramembrane protease [Aeromicrobium sp.]|nr:PrsW family glutamic-type intramembrane protease [Aeromicrobium sp.]